jgi:hypothetical protein
MDFSWIQKREVACGFVNYNIANAFPNERAFRTIIKGRSVGATGEEFQIPDRPDCQHVELAPWGEEEGAQFVERYTSHLGHERGLEESRIAARIAELKSPRFRSLIGRPVHAQMLCQVAMADEMPLDDMDEFRLFDRFVTLLLEREVAKVGRYAAFNVEVRRRFNASVAWWLLTQSGAIGTSIDGIPLHICRATVEGVFHEFDDDGLRQELVAGCLVEKGDAQVYFGHRSIQEFLAAEHLFNTAFGSRAGVGRQTAVFDAVTYATPEVGSFLGQFFDRHPEGKARAREICDLVASYDGDLPIPAPPIAEAFRAAQIDAGPSPWLFLFQLGRDAQQKKEEAVHSLLRALQRPALRPIWLMAVQALAILAPDITRLRHRIVAELAAVSRVGFYADQMRGSVWDIVIPKEDYTTLCLAAAISTEQEVRATRLILDWAALREAAHALLGYGPIFSDLALPTERIDRDRIFQHLNTRAVARDSIRRFFTDASFLRRFKEAPELEVIRHRQIPLGRTATPSPAGPTKSPAGTLSLRPRR